MAAGTIVGWDVGGAHLKAALLEADGSLSAVAQLPCPLWQGTDTLVQALRAMCELLQVQPDTVCHVVTMTGELVDCFPSRREGVSALARILAGLLGSDVGLYAGTRGFLPARTCGAEDAERVASANWLASAHWLASQVPQALLVDLGSTTADLVPLYEGTVVSWGHSDHERLAAGELVYTGVVRTPLMGLAAAVPWRGREVGVMAEWFAATADIYRLTGDLPAEADQHPTADGGPKTAAASARRLCRMIGIDLAEQDVGAAIALARHYKELQVQKLTTAAQRIVSRGALSAAAPVLGAGVGRFLVAELADRLGRPYRDATGMLPPAASNPTGHQPADLLPAVAVALMARARAWAG